MMVVVCSSLSTSLPPLHLLSLPGLEEGDKQEEEMWRGAALEHWRVGGAKAGTSLGEQGNV